MHLENVAMPPEKVEVNLKVLRLTKKKSKPSREERGYTDARGKKDDWRQFFQGDNKEFRDKEPDFSEEGWARRAPKKK